MSVWDIAMAAREEEGFNARLGVRAIQSGRRDPAWYLEEAGRQRAVRYEFEATGRALAPLWDARLAELKQRRKEANARFRGASA